MGHQPQILPDFTLLIQVAIFFATYFVLKIFVFKPYLALFRMREEKTSGLKAKALSSREQADKLKQNYQTFMQEERKKTAEWVDEQRKDIIKEERQVVGAAREKALDELKVVREKMARDLDQARGELSPQVSEFSSEIASNLLGYKVKVTKNMGAETSPSNTETTVPG